jgi:hypothetical protein
MEFMAVEKRLRRRGKQLEVGLGRKVVFSYFREV